MPPPHVSGTSRARRAIFAVASLSALGCASGEPEETRAPGTVEMAARLEELAREVEPRRHPYVVSFRLDSARAADPPSDPVPRLLFEAGLARDAIRAGDPEDAIERFEPLLSQLAEAGVSRGALFAVMESLGLAYLRVWERDHCVGAPTVDPCLFPVRPSQPGVVSARAAAGIHAALLDAEPGHRTARWLLNLSHMMAGAYPSAVPALHLIPPDALQAEHDLGRFPDRAPELGLDVLGHAGGAIMDDFDGDGLLDIVASSWHLGDPLRYFRNRGDGGFDDLTRAAGLEGITGGLNLTHADYDNDGALDILVLRGAWTSYGEPPSLLRNLGDGTFEDVTFAAGLGAEHPSQTASWGDFDNDGWLDLYVGNETTGEDAAANQLFRNNRDGTFTDVASSAGADVSGFVKAVAWGDVDNDGWLDLYVSRLLEPNVLLRNEGPGPDGPTFTDVTTEAGVAEPIASFPVWFWDYDQDGWLDLWVSGYAGTPGDLAGEYLGVAHEGEVPRLYRNDGDGTFTDVAAETDMARVLLTMGSNFGDLDNDGFLDFYAGTGEANMQTIVPNRMFRNARGERFQDVTVSGGFGHLGKGHGVSFGDVDLDGDQDIYVTMGGAYEADVARNLLFENPGHGNRWISLQLVGVDANRSAVGARVRLDVRESEASGTLHRTVGTGSSFGSNSLVLEIGLGQATSVEAIHVVWPGSGLRERFGGPPLDGRYRLVEGSGVAAPIETRSFRLGNGVPPSG